MAALSVRSDDSRCLFSLCLLYAMIKNGGQALQCHHGRCVITWGCPSLPGIHPKLLEAFCLRPLPSVSATPHLLAADGQVPHPQEGGVALYNSELVCLLLSILDTATAAGQLGTAWGWGLEGVALTVCAL